MSFQSVIAFSAASLSALYFVRGVVNDLRQERGNACGKCAAGGCPVARRG